MSSQDSCAYSHTLGIYVAGASLEGSALLGFTTPRDLAVDTDGTTYVLNRGSLLSLQRVTVLTQEEEHLREFGSTGEGDGQMMWPSAIAFDRDENLYVSDEALHRISIFSKEGEFIEKWGTQGTGDGEFDRPASIAFDNDDNLLVSDGLNNRVQRYTKDGRFLATWGKKGNGEGEFDMPCGLAVDSGGDVYVADWRNDRVQKFDAGGNYLATFGSSGQKNGELSRPAGVAVDDEGSIYVADWGNERVQIFAPDGSFIAKLRGEATMSKWATIYVESSVNFPELRAASHMEPDVDLVNYDATLSEESASSEKLFWGPTSVKPDGRGGIYVVDSCRHRIQVYRRETQSVKEVAPVPRPAQPLVSA